MLAVRPDYLRLVRGPLEQRELGGPSTDNEVPDKTDETVTFRCRLAELVSANMATAPTADSDSDSESVATLLDQSAGTVPTEPTQGGTPATSRASVNFAHTPGATGHVEAHVGSLPNRKRIHSVITHEAKGHDGDADVSEADNRGAVSTVGRNITIVDGSRIFELRRALDARCACEIVLFQSDEGEDAQA